MPHVTPPFLEAGDTIGVVATARWVESNVLSTAQNIFETAGFKVKFSEHLMRRNFQLAGSHEERAVELQRFLDDDELKAVIIARGGYGTVHLLDFLDFEKFKRSPKWICGYSDVTALHALLQSMGYASIHSTMPVSFNDATPEAIQSLMNCLMGNYPNFSSRAQTTPTNNSTFIEGVLYGGNLSVWCSILGSQHFPECHDGILFLEDVDEMLYHVDRMMTMLLRSGAMKNIKGICLGGFTQMKDNTLEFGFTTDNSWGSSAEETILKIADKLGVPMFHGFPAGHLSDNQAFYLGRRCRIYATGNVNRIHFI
jgi:muramoyltetrapeptide carboxypeptidase